jgi:hypothetical protein
LLRISLRLLSALLMNFKLGKMAKKKKDLDINVDTKNVDVKVNRKNGKTKIEVDTNIIDVTIDKDENESKVDIKVEEGAGFTGKLLKSIVQKILK